MNKRWIKSRTTGLVKCARTGKYFGRAKIAGAYKYESLNTFAYDVALNKLEAFLKRIRKLRKAVKKSGRPASMGDLMDEFERLSIADADLKEPTKKARINSLKRIRKTWPGIDELTPSSITYDDLKEWSDRLKQQGTGFVPPNAKKATAGNSSSSVNKAVGTLAKILDLALKKGLVLENVARVKGLRTKESYADPVVPSKENFARLLDVLRAESELAAYAAEFLACTGCRIEEATQSRLKDLSIPKRELRIRGTKTDSSDRTIPISDQLIKIVTWYCDKVSKVAKEDAPEMKLFPYKSLNKHLERACRQIGHEKITNHDLRHYFGTTCLEHGIPAHTAAAWLGHKDGGALLLRIYAHLRDQHSREQMARLTF